MTRQFRMPLGEELADLQAGKTFAAGQMPDAAASD
jgi:hypothetical protein